MGGTPVGDGSGRQSGAGDSAAGRGNADASRRAAPLAHRFYDRAGNSQTGSIRVLMLPRAIALSPGAVERIQAFARAGGVVLADTQPGVFDAHGRRLAASPLVGSVTLMPELESDTALGDPSILIGLRRVLENAGITLPFRLSTPEGAIATDVDARIFRNGKTMLIGLQREWTTDDPQIARDVVVNFKSPVYVHDLRAPGASRQVDHIALKLDAVTPALIAIAPQVLPLVSSRGRRMYGLARWPRSPSRPAQYIPPPMAG